MPERRICSFSGEEIEPGTGMMFVRRDGSIMWFKNSKARKNMVKLGRPSRQVTWPRHVVTGGPQYVTCECFRIPDTGVIFGCVW